MKEEVRTEIEKATSKWVAKIKQLKSDFWKMIKEVNNPRSKSAGALLNLVNNYQDVDEAANAINVELQRFLVAQTHNMLISKASH